MDVLEMERRGPAAWLWLNRPELRNALNGELQDFLLKAFKELESEKNTRVLILAGTFKKLEGVRWSGCSVHAQ